MTDYKNYLGSKLMPVTPSKITIKYDNTNKEITTIDDGVANIIKKPGLTTIECEYLLPNVKYPFSQTDNYAQYYLKMFKKMKDSKQKFKFKVTRGNLFSTNIKVTLEDFQQVEDATKDARDVRVTCKFKQYKAFSTKTCTIQKTATQDTNTQAAVETTREVSESAPSNGLPTTVTVQKGDTLWGFAKQYYGNGSLYTKIAAANPQIKNPSLIYDGDTLTIPA